MNRAPYHAETKYAKNRTGNRGADRIEPAFRETSEEIPEERHTALENTETHRLEHGTAVLDSRLRKSRGDGDRKAVHRLYNRDNDDFNNTHNYFVNL